MSGAKPNINIHSRPHGVEELGKHLQGQHAILFHSPVDDAAFSKTAFIQLSAAAGLSWAMYSAISEALSVARGDQMIFIS